ncbi:type IV secretory pathway TraG/TraD family ATPase VirD4 [Rhizobium sp. OAE497]
MAAGFLLMETAPLFWPAIYENARAAILVMFFGFALLTLAGDTQGRIRSASVFAVGAALLAASALALTAPTKAAAVLLDSFRAWRHAGYSGIESIRGMVAAWDRFTEAQRLALMTNLAIGLPVPLFFVMRAISIAAPASSSRISKQGPWRARWMNRSELRQLRHNDAGLPLGLVGGAILRYRPNPKTGWRAGHHVAIAGTRAGKGVSVVIPAIIDHDGPVAVLDIKGENFAVTRRYRQSLGRQVVVLNPFGVIEPSKDQFNPLDYIRQAHLVRDIEVIAEGIVRPEGGNGAHFAEMAKSMIAAVIEVVMTRHAEADRNLITAMDLLFSDGFETTLTGWAGAPETFGTRPAAAAATFIAAGENERGAIKTTIKRPSTGHAPMKCAVSSAPQHARSKTSSRAAPTSSWSCRSIRSMRRPSFSDC